jgi:hypothetical protein
MLVELVEPHLGMQTTDPRVAALLARLGVQLHETAVPEGEFRAYAERPDLGFSLVFTDENYFRRTDGPIGTGAVVLSGLFLYIQPEDNYRSFEGLLPYQLQRSDFAGRATALFGPPTTIRNRPDGSMRLATWKPSGARAVSATYSVAGELLVVSLLASESEA